MTIDSHTPCPLCPRQVRALYSVARRLLACGLVDVAGIREELRLAVEELAPFYAAHYEDQRHAFSEELEAWRDVELVVERGPMLPLFEDVAARP
jgi:hypothetical protein